MVLSAMNAKNNYYNCSHVVIPADSESHKIFRQAVTLAW